MLKLPPANRVGPPPPGASKDARAWIPLSVPKPTDDQAVPFQRAMFEACCPPKLVTKKPPAYSAGPLPSSWTTSAATLSPGAPMPLPTGDQLVPFQRAMLVAATPPALL